MPEIRVAVAGLGAIGLEVARKVDAGAVPGVRLTAVATRDKAKAGQAVASFSRVPAIVALDELPTHADVVVESIPSAHFRAAAEPTLKAGRILVPLSVGALLDHMNLIDLARQHGGRIIVPSGAILGLDAIRGTAEGTIRSVEIVTRKPPAGLKGAPILAEKGLSVDDLKAPLKLFEGSAREAIRGFPANVNVAVAVSLAGIGPDRTRITVWADPAVTRNTHTVIVKSDSSDLTMTIENIPSDNPRTGRITPLSVLAVLRRLTAPLVVGS